MSYSFKLSSIYLSLCIIAFSQASIAAEPAPNDAKEKKELGEASYNVSNCESVNEDDSKGKNDSGAEQKNLDKCTPLAK